MCTRFEWGLNEEIDMLVRAPEWKEFVVLLEQLQKMEVIYNEKKNAILKPRGFGKRSATRTFFVFPPKKMKMPIVVSQHNLDFLGETNQDSNSIDDFNSSVGSVRNMNKSE